MEPHPATQVAHINEIGHIMDVVFADSCVGGCQIQQVVIARLRALELVLRIFGLPLEGEEKDIKAKPARGRTYGLHGNRLTVSPTSQLWDASVPREYY